MTTSDPLGSFVRKIAPQVDDTGAWERIQARADGTLARPSRKRTLRPSVAVSLAAVLIMVVGAVVGSVLIAGSDVRDSQTPRPYSLDTAGDDIPDSRGTPLASPIAQVPEGADPDAPGPADQVRPDWVGEVGAALDSRSGRIVAFSQRIGTWTFDVVTNRWRNMKPATEPASNVGFTLVYDAQADLTIALSKGGTTIWAYSAEDNSWTRLSDTYPGRRAYPFSDLAAYDPVSGRTLVLANDRTLWAFAAETNTWTELHQTGDLPPWSVLGGSFLSYDESADQLVLAALGYDTWTYDLGSGAWHSTKSRLSGINQGWGLSHQNVAYDAAHGRTVVFSDGVMAAFTASTGTWSIIQPGPGWPELETVDDFTTGPLARLYHSLLYDPVNERIVMLGGSYRIQDGWVDEPGDVWAYDLGSNTWIQLLAPR